MRSKLLVKGIFIFFCLAILGCNESPPPVQPEQSKSMQLHIEALKKEKQELEKTLASLEKQNRRIEFLIVSFEDDYNKLFGTKPESSFWRNYQWMSWQLNVVLLLVLVVWLLYSIYLRKHKHKTE